MGYKDLAARGPLWMRLVSFILTSGELVALGAAMVSDLQSAGGRSIRIIGNAATPPSESIKSRIDPTVVVVFLSNLHAEKGAVDFLRVAHALRRQGLKWTFKIAGAGSAEDIRRLRDVKKALGLEDVEYVGALNSDEKWQFLRAADILVFPSVYRYEAQPLTIIEALSVGLPVFAYDVGGLSDLVLNGRNGALVAPGDWQELSKQLAKYDSVALRSQSAAQSRELFIQRYSFSSFKDAWRQVI